VLTTGLSDQTSSKPYMMEINAKTGKTENFVYFEKVVEDNTTEYIITNGFHHDIRDPADGQEYYYSSFIYNTDKLQLVKANRNSGEIKWNYIYESKVEVNPYHIFLHQDQSDQSRMFWIGTLSNTVNIIKFDKYSANSIW
jgi:hypothetical protein